MKTTDNGTLMVAVNAEESRLIDYIRRLQWGEIKIKVKRGKPVMVQESLRETKLTDD